MKKPNNSSSISKQYHLATSSRRIWVRLLEYLLLIGINILIAYLYTFSIVNWGSKYQVNYHHIHFSLAMTFAFVTDILIWFFYFVLIPYWWKGYTPIYWIFKLKLHPNKDEWKLVNFFKREIFTWLLITLVLVFVSLISFAFKDPIKYFASLSFISQTGVDKPMRIAASFMSVLLILSVIPSVGIIINTIANNMETSIVDRYSHIRVIYLNPVSNTNQIKQKANKKDLPIMIDEDELDKL